MHRSVTLAVVGLVAVVVIGSVGCEQKLTYRNFELVHEGASPLSVEKTLGEPWVKVNDQWTWNDSERSIVAHIWYNKPGSAVDAKVIAKQWIDPKRGSVGGPPGGQGEVIRQETRIMTVE